MKNYPRSLDTILADIQTGLSFTGIITSVAVSGSSQVLTLENIYYIQPKYKITIGSDTFDVQSINETNRTVTIAGSPAVTPGTFTLYSTYFKHATPDELVTILSKKINVLEKTPLIYLMEQYREKFNPYPSVIERESTFSLFFLTWGPQDDAIDNRQLNCVNPMRRLCEEFLEELRSKKGLFDMRTATYEIVNWTKLGVYVTRKGTRENMLADNYIGVELQITLPIKRQQPC